MDFVVAFNVIAGTLCSFATDIAATVPFDRSKTVIGNIGLGILVFQTELLEDADVSVRLVASWT